MSTYLYVIRAQIKIARPSWQHAQEAGNHFHHQSSFQAILQSQRQRLILTKTIRTINGYMSTQKSQMNWPTFHKSFKIFEEQHQETFKEVKLLRFMFRKMSRIFLKMALMTSYFHKGHLNKLTNNNTSTQHISANFN